MDDRQEQNLNQVDLMDSQLQQVQAGRDLIAAQNSQVTIHKSFISFFGNHADPVGINWERADRILRSQRREIKQRLRDTLLGGVLSRVDFLEKPDLVARIKSQLIALESVKTITSEQTPTEILDPTKPLMEIYTREDVAGRLLIVGTPGAGKTTTLLTLADQLVDEAISNHKTVIPIIFELSTWRSSQSIEDWLIG